MSSPEVRAQQEVMAQLLPFIGEIQNAANDEAFDESGSTLQSVWTDVSKAVGEETAGLIFDTVLDDATRRIATGRLSPTEVERLATLAFAAQEFANRVTVGSLGEWLTTKHHRCYNTPIRAIAYSDWEGCRRDISVALSQLPVRDAPTDS